MRIILSARNSASSVIRSVAGDLGAYVPAAIAAGAALAGIGIAMGIAIKQAADFQQGLNRLITGAGDTTDNMQQMGQAILGVSVDTGVASSDLLKAMYLIISSHQRGAQAIDTLRVASEGAVIEQASAVDVANTLSGVMTNYGTKTFNATQYMNGLIVAVQQGKITLEQLAVSMGPIDPIAQQLGISFNDMAAAMTTQTNAMIPYARAATGLRFMMQALENPTKKATDAMAKMGLNSVDVANEMKKSLPGALEMIYKAALKAGPENSPAFNRAFQDMVGGMRSWSTAAALTGTHMADFVKNSALIKAAMEHNKTAVIGWGVAQSNFNVQMDRAKAALNVLLITIGSQLLPILTRIVSAVTPLITAFAKWISNADHAKTALAILGGVIAGLATIVLAVAIPALIALITTMWPILLAGAAVGAAVFGIILAIQHWGAIMQWAGGIFSWLGTHVHDILSTIGSFIGGVFNAIGTKIHDILTGIKNDVGGFFSSLGGTAHQKVTDFKNFVGDAFSGLGSHVHDALEGVKSTVTSWGNWLYNHNYYVKRVVDAWPGAIKIVQKDIETILTAIRNFFGNIFSAIGTFVHDRLVWIQSTVGSIFSAIGTFIHDRLVWIQNTVGAIFSAIGTWIHDRLVWVQGVISAVWNWISSFIGGKANDAKNTVGNAFSQMVSNVMSTLGGWMGQIGSFFGNLASQAFTWGSNLIGGLINGIKSMVGGLFSQVGSIAHNIAGMLGFHSPPPMGPLHDADKYMPNMMKLFSEGIIANMPAVQRALSRVATPLASTFSGQIAPGGGASIPTTQNSYTGAPINIYISTLAGSRAEVQRLADLIEQEIASRFRGQTPGYASGGVFG